jgi:hypothetical protein
MNDVGDSMPGKLVERFQANSFDTRFRLLRKIFKIKYIHFSGK